MILRSLTIYKDIILLPVESVACKVSTQRVIVVDIALTTDHRSSCRLADKTLKWIVDLIEIIRINMGNIVLYFVQTKENNAEDVNIAAWHDPKSQSPVRTQCALPQTEFLVVFPYANRALFITDQHVAHSVHSCAASTTMFERIGELKEVTEAAKAGCCQRNFFACSSL